MGMNKNKLLPLLTAGIILLICIPYWAGTLGVPFHPDESAQLYMSADVELLFENPTDLFWTPAETGGLREQYRLLDAPLTRTLIGLGRVLTNTAALPADWVWAASWEENTGNGALPDRRLLAVGRLSVAWLFPLTLWFSYEAGKILGGKRLGWLAMGLMAANALVLLHTRRAMAESALLFCVALFIWLALRENTPAWLLGLAAGLAFCAKHSAVTLLPLGLVAVLWVRQSQFHWTRYLLRAGVYLLAFGFIYGLLNPWLWQYPVQATQAALAARQELAARQTAEMRAANADQALDTPGERLVGALAQVYFAPPAIWDVGNYAEVQQSDADHYLANPLHRLLRSFGGGGILLALTLVGIALAVRGVLKEPAERRVLVLLLLGFGLQLGFQAGFVTLPFQRYVIPLLPWIGLLMGYALHQAIRLPMKRK